jgi:hypothetical protein
VRSSVGLIRLVAKFPIAETRQSNEIHCEQSATGVVFHGMLRFPLAN